MVRVGCCPQMTLVLEYRPTLYAFRLIDECLKSETVIVHCVAIGYVETAIIQYVFELAPTYVTFCQNSRIERSGQNCADIL